MRAALPTGYQQIVARLWLVQNNLGWRLFTMVEAETAPGRRCPLAELADDELIAMYRNGDAEAFDVLFDRHYRPVFNFAACMVGNHGDAEDVLQETFLSVARSAGNYEPRGQFRAWLMRIARNRCLNCIEMRRRRGGSPTVAAIDPPSAGPSPAEMSEAGEWTAVVRREMLALPERQREALVLYAFEEMPYREIAHVLDLPVNTVKTLIYRARAALARAMERH